MKVWSREIKELEKYYKTLKGQVPKLEKELDPLVKAEDEIVALVYSRRGLEVIVTDLCERELKRPRKTEPLKGVIDKLRKEEKVPSFIITSMLNLNSLSTYGAHPKTFSPRQVRTVLIELLTIIEWYLKYRNIKIEGSVKEEEEPDIITEEGNKITEERKQDKPAIIENEEKKKNGKIIGNYKLLESIGEGGMGTVYLAEQIKPVKRRVALKIIKLGMDTKQVVARFEAERQALAVMDHPNIAKVYDAGATNTGRPYFVMELIRGMPITEYCDKHKLTTRERLEIFIPVCQAIQHAHQKGIIHRDLKPSNMLVAVQEDKPVPKIIDFGIAKAIEHRLTERTLFTEQGQLIGTPEYMSPEQAEMSGLDIDTRTDIYSLGVMLYELLVGVLPFDPKTLRETGFSEIQRIICETDPPKVSTRLSSLGDTQTSIAEQRKTDPDSLHNQLKGDLDWITMKAMTKDRTQRYASASELAADVIRHLKHEPILASPPSTLYRFKKYIARHKIGVAATTLVILAIFIGIIGTSIGLFRAKRAEKIAEEEAKTAQEVSDFLVELFKVSDPGEARGNTITAREILDKGAKQIDQQLGGQPLIQARLMATMGQVYHNLGLYEQAEQLLERMLVIRRKALGEEHLQVARGLLHLIWLYRSQGRYAEAVPLCRQAIDIMESTLGPDHPDVARAFSTFGTILRDLGDYEEARQLLEQAITISEKVMGPDHIDVARSLYHLGWLLKLTGQYDEAKSSYERALQIMEKELGSDSPSVAWCLNDLAVIHQDLGNYEEARSLLERSLTIEEKIFGPEHPALSAVINNLGALFWYLGDYDEARTYWERTLKIREKVLGPDHPDVAGIIYNLGLIFHNEKNYDEAKQLYKRALSIYEKALGPENISMASTLHSFANLYKGTGEYTEARQLYERVLEIREKALGPESSRVAECLMDLAVIYAIQDKYAEAKSFYQRSLNTYEKSLGLDHPDVAFSQVYYWAVSGNREKTLQYLKRSIELGYKRSFFKDPYLEFLHGDPEFEAITVEFKKRTGKK